MKFLFFVSVALAADGMVNCPNYLSDQEFKVCVSDEINRIWKGSPTKINFLKLIFWKRLIDSMIRSYMNTQTTQLGDAKASISALESENAQLKSDIDRLTYENILAETEIAKLQTQTDDNVNDISDLEKQLEEEFKSTNSQIDEVEEHHKELSLGLTCSFELDHWWTKSF